MEDLRYRFLRQDREIHYKYYDRKTALNLVINSKDEIIVSHRYKIQFYSSELYILQNEITLKNKVRDILLIEDDLLVVTKLGEFIKFKREIEFIHKNTSSVYQITYCQLLIILQVCGLKAPAASSMHFSQALPLSCHAPAESASCRYSS